MVVESKCHAPVWKICQCYILTFTLRTTIVNLLQRFYDPEEGSIFIDGQNLREIDLIRYRHEVGVVTQDPTLFDGSILDNILYGSPGATREEAIEAARVAHANVFCEAIGYDTMTGERGVTLSGGQRQRIVLARALVRKPRLLLLDEATSGTLNTSHGHASFNSFYSHQIVSFRSVGH